MKTPTQPANHTITLLSALFFTAILGLILKTFQDYGITWDEGGYQFYGTLILKWYQSGFRDTAAIQHPFLIFYGGFFNVLVQLANLFSPLGTFETRHLLTALFGLGTILMCFKISKNISGYLAGFFSALFLILHPGFFGHMFNNPVDLPFGAMLLTTVYYLLSTYDHLPKLPAKDLLKFGFSLGLMLAIRVGGLLIVLPYIIAGWSLWLGNQWFRDRAATVVQIPKILMYYARNIFWILAIAWPVMLAWWPWAQINPILNPWKATFLSAKWTYNATMPVFFNGSYYTPYAMPASYLLKSILLSLPEFYFMALILGGIQAAFLLTEEQKLTTKSIKTSFLIFAFAFPVVAAIAFNTPQFDGYRHFLFLIPLLAILGGISFAGFLRSKISRWIKGFATLVILFSLGLTAADMHRLHPYQTVYFNRILAGGLHEAAKKYETDYWGNSYREGILWVIQNYHPDLNRKIRVMNSTEPLQISYYLEKTPELRSRFETVQNDPDVFLSITRGDLHYSFPGKVLYGVIRDNTPLLYVIEPKKVPAGYYFGFDPTSRTKGTAGRPPKA